MKGRSILSFVIAAVMLLVVQVVILQHAVLFGLAFPFLYVLVLLMLPRETSPVYLLLLAFGLGMLVDVFYDTAGIHATACVTLAYLRPRLLKALTPRGGYDAGSRLTVSEMGLGWFAGYAGTLVLLHHLVLFFLEAWSGRLFWYSLSKALLSTLFTVVLMVLVQYLFFASRRR